MLRGLPGDLHLEAALDAAGQILGFRLQALGFKT